MHANAVLVRCLLSGKAIKNTCPRKKLCPLISIGEWKGKEPMYKTANPLKIFSIYCCQWYRNHLTVLPVKSFWEYDFMQNIHLTTLQNLYLVYQVISTETWEWISHTNTTMQNTQALCLKVLPLAICDTAPCCCTNLIKMSPIWLFCNFKEYVRCWGFWSS